jgi:hypothetical protein
VVLPLLPPVAVVGLQLTVLAGGPWLPHFLHVPTEVSYGTLWAHGVLLTVPSAIAVLAAWVVVRAPRLGGRVPGLLAVVVVADLVFFNAMAQSDAPLGSAADASTAPAAALASMVATADGGPGGQPPRFAIYNPDRYLTASTNAVGQPDLNVLRHVSSVQGYGAIVDAGYDAATGAHLQGNLSPTALSNGTLRTLDLGVLLTPAQYFVHIVRPAPGTPLGNSPGAATVLPPVPPDRRAPLPTTAAPPTPQTFVSGFLPVPPPQPVAPGTSRTWYFGTVLAVGRVTLPVTAAGPGPVRLRLGLLSADGAGVRWLTGPEGEPSGPKLQVTVPGFPSAAGLVVANTGQSALSAGDAVLDTAGQGSYRLDGGLSDLVTAPGWRWAGSLHGFAVFEESPAGAVHVVPAGAGRARVVSADPWGDEVVEVRSTSTVTLQRAEQYASGWQATVVRVHGTSQGSPAAVRRSGLAQAVTVPAGDHLVRFRYLPHRVDEGLGASGVGVLSALALVTVSSSRRRPARWPRRRRAGGRHEAAR